MKTLLNLHRKDKYLIAIIIITIVGFILRIYGITFGRPYLYHIDEWKLVQQAGFLLNIQNLSKEVFFGLGTYPPFFTYILSLAIGVYSIGGLLFGYFSTPTAIIEYYKLNPFIFHLIGRILSAFMGTLTIPLIYMIGKNLFNKRIGIIAALFLTFTYTHVRNSHYSTVDIAVTFFVIVAFYFISLYFKTEKNKYNLLGAIFSGISIATKYNVLFIAVTFVITHVLLNLKQKKQFFISLIFNKKLVVGVLILCFSFVFACPLIVIDFGKYLPKVEKDIHSQHSGKVGFGGEGFLSYITGKQREGYGYTDRNSFAGAMGKPLMVISLAGFIFCLLRHRKEDILLLSFPIMLYILHGNMNYKAMRHLLPLLPFLMITAAIFIDFLIMKIPVKEKQKEICCYVCSLLILIPTLLAVIKLDYMLIKKDTRTMALEWVEKEIPSDTKIAVEFYPPQIYNTREEFVITGPKLIKTEDGTFKYLNDNKENLKHYELYDTHYLKFFWGPDRIVDDDPIQGVLQNKVDYIIIDSWTYYRFYDESVRIKYPLLSGQRRKFYQWLEQQCKLQAVFDPAEKSNPGPLIKIFQVTSNKL